MQITWKEANKNNYGVGRAGQTVQYVILHWIVGTLASADATFASPTRKASAHYGVGGDQVHQYVSEVHTAWHAGNLAMNQKSIGIEHEGGPILPISEATYKTSIELVADICRRFSIPCDRAHIRKHSEVSDSPTQCPGTLDIERIVREARARLQAPVPPAPPSPTTSDQTQIPLGQPWGDLTVGTIRSQLNDLKRDRDSAQAEAQDRKAQLDTANARIRALEASNSAGNNQPSPSDSSLLVGAYKVTVSKLV